MVLWDLQLVIEFPPGASILIPSAAIYHSNTSINPEERRYSFTQFSAGGLFRWVDNGFRTMKLHVKDMSKEEMECFKNNLSEQLQTGLSLYSIWDYTKSVQ